MFNIHPIINYLKRHYPSKLIFDLRRKINRKIADTKRKPYIPMLINIVGDATVISSNCFAGRIMQDRGGVWNSPTVGLYFFAAEYIEFLTHLDYYLHEAELSFINESKYSLGNKRRANWPWKYPIGLLGGKVEIEFLHYHSEEEAAEKWHRRAARVNMDDLMIIGMEQNQCSPQIIQEFDRLPFERKVFFSSKQINLKSNVFIPEYEKIGEVGNPFEDAYIFYKYMIQYFSKYKS